MRPLTLHLVQAHLAWEDPEANRAHLGKLLQRVPAATADHPAVVVLPEMFSTGFTMDATSCAEPAEGGPTLLWMKDHAQRLGAALMGSLIAVDVDGDTERYYNRLYFVHPDGTVQHYDKRHLFRMADEHLHYTAGRRKTLVRYHGWNLLPLVCYDLRFPVWSRNRTDADGHLVYDAVIYVANWPERRRQHWQVLLQARAIENLSYAVGVNRVGQDENQITYAGDSTVIDPLGNIRLAVQYDETVASVVLDPDLLHQHRERFPAHRDADAFEG